MSLLPLFIDLKEQHCLIVGGGTIAARKLAMLCKAGACVTVVSPELSVQTEKLCQEYNCQLERRAFVEEDIQGQRLIIAATSIAAVNQQVSELAKAKGILVNVADDFTQGDVVLPSVIDRDPIQIAITTGGASPVAYGQLANLVEKYRSPVSKQLTDETQRRRFWEDVLQGPIAESVFAGNLQIAEQALSQRITEEDFTTDSHGEVYLVGAGPGDPDLLTFRALRLMQQADAVVYDRLVSDEIMSLVRKDAEKIYAGKQRSNHAIPQESINHLLVRLAKEGKRVLRLKGGDPFIFGRGGEEIETLMDEGVAFQVVPAVTAAAGCAAYSGIPLTHRDHAQACIFVTGHLKDGSVDLNWKMLAHKQQTIVFYMGLYGLSMICEQLIKHGLDSDTPAALVSKGTTPDQRVLIGDLNSLPSLVDKHAVSGPTLIIVGSVVSLHSKLHWYQTDTEITD